MTLDPRQFLSEPEEVHALVIGIGDVFVPWPPRWQKLADECIKMISAEYHYYQLGRIIGLLGLVGIIALLKGIFS